MIEWAEESMDNDIQYDDEGNEFVAKNGDQTFSKTDLKRIKADAKRVLRKDVPARNTWLAEKRKSDEQALQTFEFLNKPKSNEYKLFMEVRDSSIYRPLVEHLPNSPFANASTSASSASSLCF